MQRAEKKKRKVARYKGSKEYRVPAAKVQLADSPLFEHAGLLFLSVSLPPPFHSSLTGRMLLAMRARARVFTRLPRGLRAIYACACVHDEIYTRGAHPVCQRYTSLSLRTVSPRLPPKCRRADYFRPQKENLRG